MNFKEITPENYVKGPFMFMKDGMYYLMWSEGGWTGPDYSVSYPIANSPFGPFKRMGKIIQQDSISNGTGPHSVIHNKGTNDYYIVYHRRSLSDGTTRDYRVSCIERMYFNKDGTIKPVPQKA